MSNEPGAGIAGQRFFEAGATRIRVRESPMELSPVHLRLLLDPIDGKQFVHARLLPLDAHRFQESLLFLRWAQ